ncbi:MAG: alkaline phosphatase family protein [Terriglobia bacterium]
MPLRRAQLLALVLTLVLLPASTTAQENIPADHPQTRYLVICLDGVGYDLVEEMYRRGELRHFHPPIPLLAPFPTLTNLGVVEILAPLGARPARGYEDYYFDPAANHMRGGFFHRFRRKSFVEGSYRELFDYHPHPIAMTLEYALPVLGPWIGGRISLSRIKRKFRKSREPVFLAFFDATDPAAHISGKWLLRHFLRRLDRLAGQLRHRARQPVEVVLFSDHGNHFTKFRKVNLAQALKRAGFRVEAKLTHPHSVVIPRYGLVSAAVLYTQVGREPAVAEALLVTPGIDLVAYRTAEGIELLSRQGRALVLRRGPTYRYLPQTGDPLALAPLAAHLPADPEGFIHEDDWLAATADHIYPDPLRRLWFAFEGLVEPPASVLVSLEDGYCTGSRLLDLFSLLRATHGNLRRAQSLAFAMSTADFLTPPRTLRARDLFPLLARQASRPRRSPRCRTFLRTAYGDPAPLTRPER